MWRGGAAKRLLSTAAIRSSRFRFNSNNNAINPALGAAASVAALAVFYAEKMVLEQNQNQEFFDDDDEQEDDDDYYYSPGSGSNTVAACQSAAALVDNDNSPPSFFVRKRKTMELLDTHAEVSPLRSKYNVKWRNPIGEGTFGKVYLATSRNTGERFALKKIDKGFTDEVSFQREMDALMKVRDAGGHPYICGMHENFEEGQHYQIILDLIRGGEMFDQLANEGPYSEADAARLLREVTSALAFLHGLDIVHTDMKPENIMLSTKSTEDASIKLVDFGCAHVINEDDEGHTPAATPAYCPPEVLKALKENNNNDSSQQQPKIAPSFDMWSLGVIAYIMLVGRHPFDLECTLTDDQLEAKILSSNQPPALRNSPYTKHLSEHALDMLEKLIVWDPTQRYSAEQLLEHPWIRGETACSKKIANSDRRLAIYKEHEHSVMRSFFKGLIQHSDSNKNKSVDGQSNNNSKTSVLEAAFRNLDPQQRGYISTKELQGDKSLFGSDAKLSMAEVSELLSQRMTNRYFSKGSTVYNQGEDGNTMYFINSGSIVKSSRNGFTKKRCAGEFFGEDAMLVPNHKRIYTIHCNTPVHAIEISKQDYEKYLKDDPAVQMIMNETIRLRKRENTKTILGLQQSMEPKDFTKGDVIFSAGDQGNTLYILEQGDVDIFVQGHKVRSLREGEMTGEHAAFYLNKPYNVTAVCKSPTCRMQTISELHKVLEANHSLQESFQHIILYRDFKKALVATIQKPFPTSDEELREAFDLLDPKHDGFVSFEKLRQMVRNFDSHYSEDQIEAMLQTLDLSKTGKLTWPAFHRMYCNDKDM